MNLATVYDIGLEFHSTTAPTPAQSATAKLILLETIRSGVEEMEIE